MKRVAQDCIVKMQLSHKVKVIGVIISGFCSGSVYGFCLVRVLFLVLYYFLSLLSFPKFLYIMNYIFFSSFELVFIHNVLV